MKESDRDLERDRLGFFRSVTFFTGWELIERIPPKVVFLHCG